MLPRLSCLFQNILFKAKPALKSDNELFSQSFFRNSWMLYTRSISSKANSQKENENRPETENLETETQGEKVKFYILISKTGEKVEVEGNIGDNVMRVATANDVGMEGACEGTLACTTCHVYVEERIEEILSEPSREEEDLLDQASFLKPNSRLSCQIKITKELEGAVFALPLGTVNMYVDKDPPKRNLEKNYLNFAGKVFVTTI